MKYGLFVLILFFSNISIGNNLSNKILAVVNNNIITSQEIKSKLDIAASLDEKKSILACLDAIKADNDDVLASTYYHSPIFVSCDMMVLFSS